MSKEFRIPFPALFPEQERILASRARFNVVAAGRDAGKTTAAIDALLVSDFGALNGFQVGFFLPDDDAVLRAKRQVFALIQPLLTGRLDRSRVDLVNGGSIYFFALDKDSVELWDQLALVVVDDCHRIERIFDTWSHVLEPMLSRHRGRAWLFGKPQGMRNGFAKLYALEAEDARFASWQLPTEANPHFDRAELERDRDAMAPEVFLQERGAVFVDVPIELSATQTIIGRDETFVQWCDRLSTDGLMVDSRPFTLDNRPAMRWIYNLIPSTVEEGSGKTLVLMKCAQVGFTILQMLAGIYLAIKLAPVKIGMYVPDMKLAGIVSTERFMPIVRTVPAAYAMMREDPSGAKRTGDGNVMVRNMGSSRFYFMWTSGKAMTESIPLDILNFDEVQEMSIASMEKTTERLSASRMKYRLMGSTANWPDSDIHWWYKRGTQHQFHTRCPSCGDSHVLDEYFPDCIGYDEDERDYRYVCKSCHGWIDNTQDGDWIAKDPDAKIISVHFPQFLSPTVSAREIIEAYNNADDLKNFFNRKLGKPYTDPSQVPVNLEMLNLCAADGMAAGLAWKDRARGAFMGLDQMGSFIVAIIKERMPDGRQAVIHLEYIYIKPTTENPDASPWDRCDELMVQYGIQLCVVETLPNYDSAKSFARRHNGKVFLAGYGDMKDDMLRWGDAPRLNTSDRRTNEEARDRFVVTLDQYKCMQVSMMRFAKRQCIFPDPNALTQEVLEKGQRRIAAVCKEYAFLHFTKTALVAEKDEEQKKYRRKVVKVGIDPHTSYANMLCDVAWARAHGTSTFIFPDDVEDAMVTERPGGVVNSPIINMVRDQTAAMEISVCGGCLAYSLGNCTERYLLVKENDAACDLFVPG